MTYPDWIVPVAAFLIGAGTTTVVWWVWDRTRPDRAAELPIAEARSTDPEPTVPAETATASTVPRAEGAGYLRTSQRVILHLAVQPRLAFGDVAPVSVTQAGMSHSLAVAQPALARVLSRLVEGQAILVMRTHVAGQARRLKVYQLTVLGEAVARDLRARQRSKEVGAPTTSRSNQVVLVPPPGTDRDRPDPYRST